MAGRICLGRIAGAHGLRGQVLIRSYTGEADAIGSYGALWDADGRRRFEVTVERVTPKGVIARIAGVADRTAAEAIKGVELYVERDALPETEEDEFYYADLIGLTVETREGKRIGTVSRVDNFGAGDIIEVSLDGGGARLLPFTRQVVVMVDVTGRRITVDPPGEVDAKE